ncbi:hypothetical protein K503DRAFT_860229 [Rhizopogon vinicolor AM-OR11-026]|uniref:Uncharacterized protein n=1 Tax=Rhizopogon vinicolor AM-OR11-026 TaxID=1314800 RepID=A0A1B7MJ33_9AGAM|nr:hypothetical protein K503DRAFT_860229 [Rhizopogon vinicolor AM-OR11-026]
MTYAFEWLLTELRLGQLDCKYCHDPERRPQVPWTDDLESHGYNDAEVDEDVFVIVVLSVFSDDPESFNARPTQGKFDLLTNLLGSPPQCPNHGVIMQEREHDGGENQGQPEWHGMYGLYGGKNSVKEHSKLRVIDDIPRRDLHGPSPYDPSNWTASSICISVPHHIPRAYTHITFASAYEARPFDIALKNPLQELQWAMRRLYTAVLHSFVRYVVEEK